MKHSLLAGAIVAVVTGLTPVVVRAAPQQTNGTSRLQRFIENSRYYPSLPRLEHQPEFRLVRMEEPKYRDTHFWIMDGIQKIGLLNLWIGEIEMFRFFPPPEGTRVEYKMPEVHHWATLQGPRLSIVPQGSWTNDGEMAYLQDKGNAIRLRYTRPYEGKSRMVHSFALRFDTLLGYVWDCTFELKMESPQRFEYANMLTGGLADSRDERKRYQKCIWTRRDGTFCYMYQNPRSLIQAADSEWTDMPADNGFVGWVAERDMNPFLEITSSTPRTTFATCSVWYDQHVFAVPPTQPGEDGLYRISATYRMLSLPLPIAKELETAARTMLPAERTGGAMGFRQGIVNDFESLIPAGTLYNGCMWGHSAQYDETTGHSGTHSLRLYGGQTAQPVHGGPPIFVETAKRYRFSAWVRTRGATGKGASLRVNEIFWNNNDVRASHVSKPVAGDTDWTRLEIEFKPVAGDPFVVPGLIVAGRGVAWFDDIELVEIPQ